MSNESAWNPNFSRDKMNEANEIRTELNKSIEARASEAGKSASLYIEQALNSTSSSEAEQMATLLLETEKPGMDGWTKLSEFLHEKGIDIDPKTLDRSLLGIENVELFTRAMDILKGNG